MTATVVVSERGVIERLSLVAKSEPVAQKTVMLFRRIGEPVSIPAPPADAVAYASVAR